MKRTWVALYLVGCGSVSGEKIDAAVTASDTAVDTAMIDAPGPRCDPAKPFGAPVVVMELNTTAADATAWLSLDEREVWFGSSRPGSQSVDIYRATRASRTDPFGMPALVAGVNTTGINQRPTLTADGLTMYIEHLPPAVASQPPWRVHVATRTATNLPFGTPTVAPAPVSSAINDVTPFVMPDHSALYWLSGGKLWRSARTSGVFQTPVENATVTVGGIDYPVISPDELTIYFTSSRTGTLGDKDIWRASRASVIDAFSTPVNVGAPVNTALGEVPTWVSGDDCVLYLFKDNGGNLTDLFMATRPL